MQARVIRKPSTERMILARPTEEVLVADSRAGLTPSQMVERKLIGLLRGTPLPVSQLANDARRRGLS
jgi:hypothetical protein